MLFTEGYAIWLAAAVGTIVIVSAISLFSQDHSTGDSVKPTSLSNEDRTLLQATELETRKRRSNPDRGDKRKLRRDREAAASSGNGTDGSSSGVDSSRSRTG